MAWWKTLQYILTWWSFHLRSMTGNKTYALTPRTPKTTSRNACWPTSEWSLWNILESIWGKAPLVSPKGCVCVNRVALPFLHYTFSRPVNPLASSQCGDYCRLPSLICVILIFSDWWVRGLEGKAHSVADCQSPPLEKIPLPFPPTHPHTPVCSQNRHDSKWLAGYVIMIIALFFSRHRW